MNFGYIAIVFIIVIASVILHELSHGVVAYLLGDHTAKDAGRLSLNPIKHIDPYMSILVPVILFILKAPVFGGAKPIPINKYNLKWQEWGMALVAIAGPLTNLLLAFICFLISHFTGLLYGSGGELPAFIFYEAIAVNLGFAVFNAIPIPPLDGSRVLYALSPDVVRGFLASIEPYGILVVYGLILILGQVFSGIMVGAMNGIFNFFYWIVGS